MLRANYLAGLHALGAHVDALDVAVDDSGDLLDVRTEHAVRHPVRVALMKENILFQKNSEIKIMATFTSNFIANIHTQKDGSNKTMPLPYSILHHLKCIG